MIPNITRGDRMSGLLGYLAGPGRGNEHESPHLVAGTEAMMAWHSGGEINRDEAMAIARHVDKPRKAFGVEVVGGHVWHCSLSLRADEGTLTDEKWGQIARDFVAGMGFDDRSDPRVPCRWVAVRHGVSKNGNDHIHIVVNLVREDGTKASTHHDYQRAQTAARALEIEHGLEELESVRAERATRGYDPAERQAQARVRARGRYERYRAGFGGHLPGWQHLGGAERQQRIAAELKADQPRYVLALKVRGCAAASQDEAEFVRRMRRSGLLVRPRFLEGGQNSVTGYSVAERPQFGERPIWYGGGHLGRDLTLPRLRDQWPDNPTASDSLGEWTAAKQGRRIVTSGRETAEVTAEAWQKAVNDARELGERLDHIPLGDRAAWATIARQTAGVLAAWSNAIEDTPGDLAAAAEELSRSAQTYRRTPTPQHVGRAALSSVALVAVSAARGGQGVTAQALLIRQMLKLAAAVYDASVATGQKRQAQLLLNSTRERLIRVRDSLPKPVTAHQMVASRSPVRSPDQARIDSLPPELRQTVEIMRASNALPATAAPQRPGEPVQRPRAPERRSADRGQER